MAITADSALRPTFEQPRGGGKRPDPSRDNAAAIKTYRYLRLGMLLIVLALLGALLKQWRVAGCAQGSISAYYYTPVGPLFIGGMVAIGVSLLVIKGATVVEDVCLSMAGMLAPIVAFVPTTYEPGCVPHELPGKGQTSLPPEILERVHNNIWALLVAGSAAILVGLFLILVERNEDKVSTGSQMSRWILLSFNALVVLAGWWWYSSGRIIKLHGWSAVFMFAALAVASLASGVSLWRIKNVNRKPKHWKWHVGVYLSIGALMVVLGVVIDRWPGPWAHRTLVQELVEISLFVVMWLVQSIERWGKIISA
jgi:hypothetical protein